MSWLLPPGKIRPLILESASEPVASRMEMIEPEHGLVEHLVQVPLGHSGVQKELQENDLLQARCGTVRR
jgi:hypothetical protein